MSRRNRSIHDRTNRLLNAVRNGTESSFSTINGDEENIIRNAQRFRDMNEWSHGKAYELVDHSIGWMQKQEVFRFLTMVDEKQWQQALNLVEYCGTADLSFNAGILDSILHRAEADGVPPEWIADETLDDLKPLSDVDSNVNNESLNGVAARHGKHKNHASETGSIGFTLNKDALRRG